MTQELTSGISRYQAGKYVQALTDLLSVTPATPAESSTLAYYAGLTYMQLKRYEDALVYLEQVVTEGSSIERTQQCRLLLAVVYCLTSRDKLADFELRKLIDSGCKTAAVYAALAYIAWEQEQGDESIAYYEKALTAEEDNLSAMNGLGYVLAEMGRDISRAFSLCKKAVARAPNSPACLDSLGWVYFKMGLIPEAKQYLKQAKERAHDDEDITKHINAVLAEEKRAIANDKLTAAGAARGKTS